MNEGDTAVRSEVARYRIQVEGHLAERWSDWFDGLLIDREPNGLTTLTGVIVDQTALHSLLARIRDLGLVLLLVERLKLESHERNE